MTITAAPSEQSYAADGVSTVFAIPFPFDTAADLKLTSTDASGNILTLTTGFTISGGAGSTGNATFSVAPALGLTITIYDDPARTQPTDYVSLDAFPAESHERALDRVTRIAKRLYQLVQRSVRFPDGDVSTDGVLGSVANRKGKYLFFNAVTGAIEYAANIVTTTLSQSIIGQLMNPQTAAEITVGVVPTNYAYPAGDVRRYGADPTGVADSKPAWNTACSCNADVYDGYPGGGTYLLNSSIVVTKWPIRIRGQTRWPISTSGLNGTKLILASGAGAVPHISIPNQSYGISISRLGFTWQSATASQQGIVANNDLRYSVIEECAFVNTAGTVAGNTIIGIQLKNAAVFTGDVVIRNNFFDVLFQPIALQGACTTVKIYGNEFYGYAGVNAVNSLGAITGGAGYTSGTYNNVPLTGGTGTGATAQIVVTGGVVTAVTLVHGGQNFTAADALSASVVNIGPGAGFSVPAATVGNKYGIGVQCVYPVTGPALSMNYFEGFNTGIYSNGAAYLKQIGNAYGPNTNLWTWVKTSFARIWNQSIGETFEGAGLFNYPQNNVDACQVMSGPGNYYFDNANLSAGLGFIEQQRSVANSHWQTRTFSAGNYTASGAMTWTVAAVTTEEWEIDGQTATYNLVVTGSTAGGVANTQLKIALPFTPTSAASGNCIVQNNGVLNSAGTWAVNAGVATLIIFVDALAVTNWTLSANTGVKVMARFRIN